MEFQKIKIGEIKNGKQLFIKCNDSADDDSGSWILCSPSADLSESITGKKGTKLKDKEKYVTESGKLILFLAAGSFIMAIVMYFNTYAAVAEIIIWFVIFGILWKRMNDKYGDTGSHKKK